jgi:hypothetical protein
VALVVLAAEIGCPLCRVGAATIGNTTPSIAAAPHIRTEQPQTGLGAQRVAILSPSVRRAPGSKLAGKVATCPVPAEGLEQVIGAEPVRAIGLAQVEPTVSEAGTFRAAAAATAMASEVVRGDTADRALVAAAAAAHSVWDLEAAVVVEAGGADGEGNYRNTADIIGART